MELEEAIEELHNFKLEKLERDKLEINPRGGFKIGAIYKYAVLDTAIDTVLKELDNRIPKENIKKEIINLWLAINNIKDEENNGFTQRGAYLYCINLLKRIAEFDTNYSEEAEKLLNKE